MRIYTNFASMHGSHITSLNRGEVPNCQVLMMYRMRCLRKSDLPVYMTVALAHIRFISDLFPHMNEARIRSRYIRMHAFFPCLHCHRTDPICVTYEQKIGIGSHLTDSVNEALYVQQQYFLHAHSSMLWMYWQ